MQIKWGDGRPAKRNPLKTTRTAEMSKAAARRQRVLEMRKAGKTFGEISEDLSVSRSRAAQIYDRAVRDQVATPHGLTTRTFGALTRHFRHWRESGFDPHMIAQNTPTELLKLWNMGPTSVDEIEAWLKREGLALKEDPVRAPRPRCPHCGSRIKA